MVSFPSIGLIERRELALPQNTRRDHIPRTAFSFIPLNIPMPFFLQKNPHTAPSVYLACMYGHTLFLRLQIGQVFMFGVRNSCLVVIFLTASSMLPGRQVISLLHRSFSLVQTPVLAQILSMARALALFFFSDCMILLLNHSLWRNLVSEIFSTFNHDNLNILLGWVLILYLMIELKMQGFFFFWNKEQSIVVFELCRLK